MITHLKHVPIFNTSVFFIGNCTAEEAIDAAYRLDGRNTKVSFGDDCQGGVRDGNGAVFVWVKDLDKASVVAHELGHAAVSIMEIRNIPLSLDTEEVMCYLIGWLKLKVQDKVYAKLRKHEKAKKD